MFCTFYSRFDSNWISNNRKQNIANEMKKNTAHYDMSQSDFNQKLKSFMPKVSDEKCIQQCRCYYFSSFARAV